MKQRTFFALYPLLLILFLAFRTFPVGEDCAFVGATVYPSPEGAPLSNAVVLTSGGKIAAVGESVNAPAGTAEIDAGGKYLTPGIVDSHSHIALDDDVNEATSPITPHMMMKDAFDYQDKAAGPANYYVRVMQLDGNLAWSSPIWIKK